MPPPVMFMALKAATTANAPAPPTQVVQLASDYRAVRKVFRSKRGRMLAEASSSTARADIERNEHRRWVTALADLIAEAKLPIALEIAATEKPDLLWSQVGGKGRAGTIKGHVQTWKKLRQYCMASTGKPWPVDVAMLAQYLSDSAEG